MHVKVVIVVMHVIEGYNAAQAAVFSSFDAYHFSPRLRQHCSRAISLTWKPCLQSITTIGFGRISLTRPAKDLTCSSASPHHGSTSLPTGSRLREPAKQVRCIRSTGFVEADQDVKRSVSRDVWPALQFVSHWTAELSHVSWCWVYCKYHPQKVPFPSTPSALHKQARHLCLASYPLIRQQKTIPWRAS